MNTFAAILSGLLLTVIFPTVFNGMHLPDLSVLAWVSLVPLVLVCRRKSLPKVAFFSFVTGLTYNALVSYWIFFAMHKYGGLPAAASIGGVLSMASILAFMLAIVFVFVFWLDKKRLVPLVIALPVFWTLYEWVRNYGPFGGYPWSQLAYSQAHHLSLIQAADLFGIYGITFLIVLVNLAIVELAESIPVHRRPLVVPILMAALLLGANTAYGLWRLQDIQKQTKNLESLTIGLAQPNIPQEIKWSPGQAKKSLNILFGLTKQAVAEGADLVIWPESGYQDILATNLEEIYEMALGEASILTGVITVMPPGTAPQEVRPLLQNSAVQFDPEGRVTGMYHKTHLVPLGEYVPLKNLLGFMDKVVPAIGDFIPGKKHRLMTLGEQSYGITICYEDLFPEISRSFVLQGADFLTNITNDAWYNDSSAQWQHLAFSRLRAVENRRFMLRSTNTGITAVIDPVGRIQAQLPPFQKGILVHKVPIGGPNSMYTRYGNTLWMGILALLLAIYAVIHNIRTRKSCP